MKLTSVYSDNGTTVELTPEAARYTTQTIVSCNHHLLEQISILEGVASTEARMIIFGESGTQKQRYVEYIHRHSRRSSNIYLRFDCAATPLYKYEEELFGTVHSAIDGRMKKGILELASGGTLLLDGVSEIPERVLKKMEQFLEHGTFTKQGSKTMISPGLRLLMTCSRSFEDMIGKKNEKSRFIQKAATTYILISPLRERPEDIALLALHYMNQANKRIGCNKKMGSHLFQEIIHAPWFGNERELQSFIEQAVMAAADEVLDDTRIIRNTVPVKEFLPSSMEGTNLLENETKSLKEMVNEYELMLIHQSIKKHGSLRKAAHALQIAPSALSRKLSAEAERKAEQN